MTKQPEALRLADALDTMMTRAFGIDEPAKAAAEMRRLHEVNQELLKALKEVVAWMDAPDESAFSDSQLANLRAAIAKATGGQQ